MCEQLNEYARVTPETLLSSLVACGLPHWRIGDVLVSKECCICMTNMDMQRGDDKENALIPTFVDAPARVAGPRPTTWGIFPALSLRP